MQRVSLGRAKGRGHVFTRWVFVAVAMALCAAGSAWGEPVTFHSGDIPVTLDLALDELQVRPAQPMAKADMGNAIRARLADAEISASIDPKRLVVKLGGMAKSRAALGNAIATLRGAGFEADAVAYPFTPQVRTQEMAVLITGRVIAKFPEGTDVPAILAANGLTVAEEVDFLPNTFVLQTASGNPLDAVAVGNGLQEGGRAEWSYPETAQYYKPMAAPSDPLFPQQWHLQNTGQQTGLVAGNDVNILGAWNLATGKGVNILVVDDGVEENHPDLLPNVRKDLSTDYSTDSPDPTPAPFSGDNHGTSVAGIAAARGNNGLGVAGAAYEASIVGVKFLGSFQTDLMVSKCALHLVYEPHPVNQAHVNTNSWGPSSFFYLAPPTPLTLSAMEKGVTNGRNGKGVVYLWAAGNGREAFDDVNANGTAASRFSIALAATGGDGTFSYYSTAGSGLLVNAPSSFGSGPNRIGTTTTDRVGIDGYDPSDYTDDFGGTSSSCPLAAGIVALMLEVNPSLTWRDVQHILVDTAEKNDPASPSWANNGAGKHFSHDYGFGRVDAEAAVTAALSWTNVPPYAMPLYNEETTGRTDPPIGEISSAAVMETTLDITSNGNPFHAEAVEVFVDIKHNRRGDLHVELVSPSGMVSRLMNIRPLDSAYDMV
jgi:subtilisin family serine protease